MTDTHDYLKPFLDLSNEGLYSVPDLVDKAERMDLFQNPEQKEMFFFALLDIISVNQFPAEGDVVGSIGEQHNHPAWFGIRWENAATSNEALARMAS